MASSEGAGGAVLAKDASVAVANKPTIPDTTPTLAVNERKETEPHNRVLFVQYKDDSSFVSQLAASGLVPLDTQVQTLSEIDFSAQSQGIVRLPEIHYNYSGHEDAMKEKFAAIEELESLLKKTSDSSHVMSAEQRRKIVALYKKSKEDFEPILEVVANEQAVKQGADPEYTPITHILPKHFTPPSEVVVHVPSLPGSEILPTSVGMLLGELGKMDAKKRPNIIFYLDGFKPTAPMLAYYPGVIFCSSLEELSEKGIPLATTLTAQKHAREDLHAERLSQMQEEEYNQTVDLQEWEHRTADTLKTLRLTFERIQMRNKLYDDSDEKPRLSHHPFYWFKEYENPLTPQREIRTVLDIGVGQGRIAGMLARAGLQVIGIDMSEQMLADARKRLIEEGEGLRGEKQTPAHSYHALRQLEVEDAIRVTQGKDAVLPGPIITDDEQSLRNLLLAKGDVYTLEKSLDEIYDNWEQLFPGVEKYKFLRTTSGRSKGNKSAQSTFGIDMVTMNWNGINGVGIERNQEQVLRQIRSVLITGGEAIFEFPKREDEPYKSALDAYYQKHKDEGIPYGTLQEERDDGTPFSARYFPKLADFMNLLERVGFDVDPQKDVQSYVITDPLTGIKTTEYFVTARKPVRLKNPLKYN